jgi:hypothetical protein
VGGPVRRGTGTAATLRLTLARAPLRGAYRIRLDAVDAAGNTTLLTAGFGVRAAR